MIKPLIHNYFTFNGVSSLYFGVQISGNGTYNSPKRRTEKVVIPGRNGDLIRDLGSYENIELTYPAFIFGDFPDRSRELRNFLEKDPFYHRLEDSYHQDEFRWASYLSGFESEPFMNRAGNFNIKFNCMPQRWLKSGESKIQIQEILNLLNPTEQIALPKIYIESGTGQINVNGEVITILENENGICLDSDIQEGYALNGNLNVNGDFELNTGNFPVLQPVMNTITIPSTMEAYIVPRWWRL